MDGDLRPETDGTDLSRFWSLPLALMAVGSFDGFLIHTNDTYQRTLGWSADEATSVPYWEMVHPRDRDRIVATLDRLVRREATSACERSRVLARDGRYRSIQWSATSDPECGLIYSVGLEIADDPAAADIAYAFTGTWSWDAANGNVIASPETRLMLSLPTGDALHLGDIIDHIDELDQAVVRREFARALEERDFCAATFRPASPPGGVRWVRAAGRVLGDDRRIAGMRGILVDVTVHDGTYLRGR